MDRYRTPQQAGASARLHVILTRLLGQPRLVYRMM
jgi:hypothetical protein